MKNDFYKQMIQNFPYSFCHLKALTDENGDIYDFEYIEVNKIFEKIYNKSKKDIIGKTIDSVFPGFEFNKPNWFDTLKKIAREQGQEVFQFYSYILKKWMRIIVYSDTENDISMIIIDNDNENKLIQQSEAFFSFSIDLLCIIDYKGNFVKVNQAWHDLLGYSNDELEQNDLFKYIHKDYINETKNAFEKLEKKEKLDNFINCFFSKKDKEYKFLEWQAYPSQELIYASARDITDKKREPEYLKKMLHISEYLQNINEPDINYQEITDFVIELTSAKLVTFNFVDISLNKFTTKALSSTKEEIKRIQDIFGAKILGNSWGINPLLTDFKSDKIIITFPNIQSLFVEFFSDDQLQKMNKFNYGDIAVVKLTDGKELLGTISVHLEKNKKLKNKKLLELFAGQLSVLLKRKIDERSLIESEQKYRAVIEKSMDNVFILDMNTKKIIDTNSSFRNMLGYDINEINQLKIYDVIEHSAKSIDENIAAALKQGTLQIPYRQYRHKDGHLLDVEVNGTVIEYLGNKVLCIVCRNITEKRKADEALKKSEESFRKTFDFSPVGSVMVGLDYKFIRCNQAFCNFLGYHFSELIGKTFLDVTYFKDKSFGIIEIKKLVAKEIERVQFQKRYLTKKGEIVWGEVTLSSINDLNGNTLYLLAIIVDITEKKKAENSLQLYKQIISISNDGIAIINDNYQYLEVNPGYCNFFDRSSDEIIGHYGYEIIGIHYFYNIVKEKLDRAFAGETVRYQSWFDFTGKKKMFLDVSYTPYFNSDIGIKGVVINARDITELKLSDEAFKQSEERLRAFFNNSEAAFGIFNCDNPVKFIIVNEKYAEISNKPAFEHPGKTLNEILENDDLAFEMNYFIQKVIRTKTIIRKESVFPAQNKKKKYYDLQLFPIINSSDEIEGIGTVGLDITALRTAEEELKLRAMVLNQIQDFVAVTDLEGNITYVNDSELKTFEITENEIIGKNLEYFGDDPQKGASQKEILTHTLSKGSWRGEVVNITPKGKEILLDCRTQLVYDSKGIPIAMCGVSTDITENKRVQSALMESEIRFRRLFEDAPIPMFEEDFSEVMNYFNQLKQNGIEDIDEYFQQNPEKMLKCIKMMKISDVNAAAVSMLKYSDKEELINNIQNTFSDISLVTFRVALVNLLKKGKLFETETEMLTKDGEVKYIFMSVFNSLVDSGIFSNIIVTMNDITSIKEYERQLIRAKDSAEELNRLKTIFLANMSHEIRTPLNGILGFAQLISEQINNPDMQEIADMIYNSGARLLNTLDSILNLSRIEARKQKVIFKQVNLKEFLNIITKSFINLAESKALSLTYSCSINELFIISDTNLLNSVFNNLISNAIKYTNEGSIKVSLNIEDVNEKEQHAVIEVKDTGIGISEENQRIIFEEFRQVSEGYQRSSEGVGLGLTITKKYVELLNGRITLTSAPGAGSVFKVYLPYIKAVKRAYSTLKENDYSKITQIIDKQGKINVLVVDDDYTSILLISKLLKDFITVDYAIDYESGIDKINSNNLYRFIILDISLKSDKTGVDLLKEIKQKPKYYNTPVIAMTAFALEGDRENFIRLGFNEYLPKPFNRDNCLAILEKFIYSKQT